MSSLLFQEKSFKKLGTDIYLKIVFENEADKKKAQQLLIDAEKKYDEYHKRISRFDSESELSELNRNLKQWQEVSSDIVSLAKKSLEYNKETEGVFDPRIISQLEEKGYNKDFSLVKKVFSSKGVGEKLTQKPLEEELSANKGKVKIEKKVDFTGLAKGYITDQIVDLFKRSGFNNFLVDSGGDMFASGGSDKRNCWVISLEGYPEERFQLEISDMAIATSGITRKRWEFNKGEIHHLMDPRNLDKFNFDLQTVSVVGKSVEYADVWAKVLFILGKKKGMALAEKKKISVAFLDFKGNITISDSIKKFIKNT